MKNIKFAVIIAALISVFSLSSCLGDSNGNDDGYDIYGVALTLKPSSYGGYYLISDQGLYFNITDPNTVLSSLKLTNGGYLERFVGAVKFQEGESFSVDKTSYNIVKVIVQSQLVYGPMTTQPDTIKGDYGIAGISGDIWAANGYLNIPVKFYYPSANTVMASHFNAYATDAKEDTLYVTLQQSRKIDNTESVSSEQLFSYSFPFDKMEFMSIYSKLVPVKDSIVVKVSAKGYDKVVPFVKTTKYRYSQR